MTMIVSDQMERMTSLSVLVQVDMMDWLTHYRFKVYGARACCREADRVQANHTALLLGGRLLCG